jgi:hypothetical protein
MPKRQQEKDPPPLSPLTNPAQRRAWDEGEARRQEYLATLDPRQRQDLDPQPKPI